VQSFIFESISHRRYARLLAEHPPTEKQRKAAADNDTQPDPFDPETFAVALLSEMVINPAGSFEDWDDMLDEFNDGQVSLLFQTAMMTQLSVPESPGKSES
jgi:phage/plasmid primase-like uncharacterized protein